MLADSDSFSFSKATVHSFVFSNSFSAYFFSRPWRYLLGAVWPNLRYAWGARLGVERVFVVFVLLTNFCLPPFIFVFVFLTNYPPVSEMRFRFSLIHIFLDPSFSEIRFWVSPREYQ